MNKTNILLATAAAIALGATVAAAQEYTAGEVTKIDVAQKKLTIKHGELANLDMPAMTMVFVVAEVSVIGAVSPPHGGPEHRVHRGSGQRPHHGHRHQVGRQGAGCHARARRGG